MRRSLGRHHLNREPIRQPHPEKSPPWEAGQSHQGVQSAGLLPVWGTVLNIVGNFQEFSWRTLTYRGPEPFCSATPDHSTSVPTGMGRRTGYRARRQPLRIKIKPMPLEEGPSYALPSSRHAGEATRSCDSFQRRRYTSRTHAL